MTTRDRPTRLPGLSSSVGDAASGGGREPTESLQVEPDEQSSALALGTDEVTSVESPNARIRTHTPVAVARPPRAPSQDAGDESAGAVLGSYRILELLGKGGMGAVYRAEHVKLGREVALKLLRRDYASRRDAVARFFQEARTVNRVRHRNIVDVTDFVELDDGTIYIVMELLHGASLGVWARSGVELPRVIAVLIQICDGLAAAHQVGVVHRDLKPDNVIVVPTSDGADLVKLLDFGVAKLLNRDDEDLGVQTAAGSVIGTPAYMSPEQAGGMVIDARSDIYSLGAIMYELLCGQPMFRGRSFGEFVRKHLTEMPVPPRQTPGGAHIDPGIEAVILRCLDKDPAQRFADVGELREVLLQLLGGAAQLPALPPVYGPSLAHLSGPRPAPTSLSGPRLAPGSTSGPPWPAPVGEPSAMASARTRPRWGWWLVVGAGAIAVGVAAAIGSADAPGRASASTPAGAAAPAAPAAMRPDTVAVQPIDPPPSAPGAPAAPADPAVARPPRVEVRFHSQPSGAVFAAGKPAELCRTPCAFDIDPSDGGPTDRRSFLVKRDGYVDGAITVDLGGGVREFQVVLHRAAPEASTDQRPARRPPRPTRPRPATRDHDAPRPTSRDPAPGPAAEPARPARSPPAAPAAAASSPAPSNPTKPASKPAIDPADTLDPFHPKK